MILEGETAVAYSRDLLAVIGEVKKQEKQKDGLHRSSSSLMVLGALAFLQFEHLIQNHGRVTLPLSPSGFPEINSMMADASATLDRKAQNRQPPHHAQIAAGIVEDLTNLDLDSLLSNADKRVAQATNPNSPLAPWQPESDDFELQAAIEAIDFAKHRRRRKKPIFEIDQGQLTRVTRHNHPSPSKALAFKLIPLSQSGETMPVIMQAEIGNSDGHLYNLKFIPDQQADSPIQDFPDDYKWLKPKAMKELLAALDFNLHPDQNAALLSSLAHLTAFGAPAIKRITTNPDPETYPVDMGVITDIVRGIKKLPDGYSGLVQAMLKDSLSTSGANQ